MAKKIKSFEDIIGHKNLINYLKKCIERDNVPNIMIIHGNPGLGKSSIAKLLAIEVTTKFESKDIREKYIHTVISKNQSTDSIKLFNMSEIQEKEEEIGRVKAEFSLGFSKTGRKVIILDEAHNMSRKAQDAILTDIEHLQNGIYIFICTTEVGALRDALISRSKATIRLSDLTQMECKHLIRNEIIYRHLAFEVNLDMVIALVADWAGNQPRKALNLIENFEEGSLVTVKELEVFIDTNTVPVIIELLKYLYGSLTLGLDYLDSVKYDSSFVTTLIEVCKIALGHVSHSVSNKDTIYIKKFMQDRNPMHILKFTAEVAGLSTIQKRRVIAAFIRAHVAYTVGVPPVADKTKSFQTEDKNVLMQNIIENDIFATNETKQRIQSVAELFEAAEVVD